MLVSCAGSRGGSSATALTIARSDVGFCKAAAGNTT